MSDSYPVKWRNRKLAGTLLTDEKKAEFSAFVFNHLLDEAARRMAPTRYMKFERRLTADPPEWTSLPDDAIAAVLNKPGPQRQLYRVVFGLSADPADEAYMSDEDLDAMVAEKADPKSDLRRVMTMVLGGSDPLAPRGEPGSPRPEAASGPTPPSATSPSA